MMADGKESKRQLQRCGFSYVNNFRLTVNGRGMMRTMNRAISAMSRRKTCKSIVRNMAAMLATRRKRAHQAVVQSHLRCWGAFNSSCCFVLKLWVAEAETSMLIRNQADHSKGDVVEFLLSRWKEREVQ